MKYIKGIIAFVAMFIIGVTFAPAQTVDNTEGYVGVQFQRSAPDVRQTSFRYDQTTDAVGVNASVTEYFAKNLGVTGEAAATFNNTEFNTQNYTAQGGLTLKSRKTKLQPFVRALGGVAINRSENELTGRYKTSTGGVVTLGGGLDYKNWRIFQADYQVQRIYNNNVNYFRVGTGIVW